MIVKQSVSIALMGFIFVGCAVSHTPSIMVLPRGNASYAEFQTDEADCQQYAEARSSAASKQEFQNNFGRTLLLGLLGAAAGASYGSHWGMSGYGARVGATQGLTSGVAYGAAKEEVVGQNAFDLTYTQCMRTKGHKLPGFQSIDDQPVQASSGNTSPRATRLPPAVPQPIFQQAQPQPALSQPERVVTLNIVQLQSRYNASRLYLQPNLEAARLSTVSAGVNLKVIENREAWLYIETPVPDERRGWILTEWTQK